MKKSKSPSLLRTLGVAALAGTMLFLTAPTANAGQCPADKISADSTPPSDLMAKGVSDMVLASIDVSKEPAHIEGRLFRIRQLQIEPGGVVPWHSHGDRPALIYIVKGEIIEHASNCAVPIIHKAGEVSREVNGISHWWKNTGSEPVVLISADLLHDHSDKNM